MILTLFCACGSHVRFNPLHAIDTLYFIDDIFTYNTATLLNGKKKKIYIIVDVNSIRSEEREKFRFS